MNLQEVNTQYLGLKKRLVKTKEEIEKLDKEASALAEDRTILSGKIAQAKRDGDKVAEQEANKKLNNVQKRLQELAKATKAQKEQLAVITHEIDKKMEEIKSIPGMREHLNEIIRKQSERKMPSVEEELKPVLEEKAKLEQILLLTATHPIIENNLKGLMSATRQLENLKTEIEALKVGTDSKGMTKFKDEKRAAHILNQEMPGLRKKLTNSRNALLTYFKKNSISITEVDLDALVSGKIVMNKRGEVDLKTTMAAKMGAVDRKIKGIQKKKEKLERTIQNVGGTRNVEEPTRVDDASRSEEPTRVDDSVREEYGVYNINEPAQKPKWWQFVKRFRMWNERRQQQRLEEEYDYEEPEELTNSVIEDKKEVAAVAREHSEFKDSLKYEILRDVVEKEMKDQLKKAKQQGRNNPEGR